MTSVALFLVLAAGASDSPAVGLRAPSVQVTLTQDDEAFQIGSMLRCPVCQGMPISESPSTMAQDMMKLVRQMLAEGKPREVVLDYFVERYGEWVLLEPKAAGANLGLWVLPGLALFAGLFLVVRFGRPRRADKGPAAGTHGQGPAAAAPQRDDDDDPCLQALRREVDG